MFGRLFKRKKEKLNFSISEVFISSWGELKPEDIAYLVALKNEIADDQAKGHYSAAGLKKLLVLRRLCRYKYLLRRLGPTQKADIYNDLFIHQPFYQFFLPYIKAGGVIFKAPDEKLADVSFANFKYIDAEFTKCTVLAERNIDYTHEVARFAAALYLPYAGGDKRMPFHTRFLEDHSPLIKRNITVNEGVLLINTYAHIRHFIVNKYPHLFPKSNVKVKKPAARYSGNDWKQIHYSLGETEAFKGFDKAGEAMLSDALGYLDWKAKQAMEEVKRINRR